MQYNIISVIVNKAIIFVIASLILGITVPSIVISNLFPLLPLFLIGMMFSSGLMLSIHDIVSKGFKPSRLAVIIPLQYIASTLFGFISAYLLIGREDLIFGQVLHGSMPSEQTIPVWVKLANGNIALSISILALSTSLSPLVSPAIVYVLVGKMVEVDYVDMMLSLLITVLLPLALGSIIRSKVSIVRRYDELYQASSILSALPTVMVIGALAYTLASATALILVSAFLASLIHLISTLALGFYIQKALAWDEHDGVVLIYNISMKEFTVTLSILSSMGLSPIIGLPAALYGIMHMVAAPIIARYFSNRLGSFY
jgi:BASS family bile acid:Na+ symporter